MRGHFYLQEKDYLCGRKIKYNDMTEIFKKYSAHYRQLLRIGIPIIIGQLGVIILGFADTMMIGHYGTSELAAASFVNNIFSLVILFGTGFSYGLTPIVGELFGKGDKGSIGEMLKNSIVANFITGAALTAIMLFVFANVENLGQPVELLPLIKPYYLIILSSVIFVMLFNAFKQFADGITDTDTPMWILMAGNLLNIIGNYVLIYGKWGFPELGLDGAGISTLASRILMFVAFAIIFFTSRKYAVYRQSFMQSRIRSCHLVTLNRMGLPVALQMGMESGSFALSAVMVGWLGSVQLAAHQVMTAISTLGYLTFYGMGAAAAIRVSYFKGQNDNKNVRRSAYASYHLTLALAVVMSIIFLSTRNFIGALFVNDNMEVVQMVSMLMIPLVVYQFGDGTQVNFANSLRGIADVKPMMVIAFIAYFVVALPVGYFCGFVLEMGIIGIWIAFPIGLTLAGLLFWARFEYMTKKKA